jgi:hypothetical protein
MLPDDGPNGPKHVGAIYRDILSVTVAFYVLIKSVFVGKRALNFGFSISQLGSIQYMV